MARHTALASFSIGTIFLICGLALASSQGAAQATGPAISAAILLLVVYLVYCGLSLLIRKTPHSRSFPVRLRQAVWLAMFALMFASMIAVVFHISTTASFELFKRITNPYYRPALDDLEIRLSTAYMPIWVQALFELARRIAALYCLVEFFFSDIFTRRRMPLGLLLIAMLTFFVFSTLDRVIPVLYFSAAIMALFVTRKRAVPRSVFLYMNIAGIVLSIVLFKQVQYGDFKPFDFAMNSEISHAFTASQAPSPKSPEPAQAHRPKWALYVQYAASTVVERLVLSPVAMILYVAETYDDANYLHWRATRIFSILGFGRYVDPLEQGVNKHHDAFPVTYIGDLWRNGGPSYFPMYAIFMGLVLFAMDRFIFARRGVLAWQLIGLFGIAFLFFGNAFNVTSWTMIGASLAVNLVASRLKSHADT